MSDMKYKLPRPIFNKLLHKIASREVSRQMIKLDDLDEEHLEEIYEVSKTILKKGLPEEFVLKKLPENVGYGIFLRPDAEPIYRGTVIASYSGKLQITPEDEPIDTGYVFSPLADIKLLKEEHKALFPDMKYKASRKFEISIDAFEEGNFTRYINHSEEPNVESVLFATPKNPYGLVRLPIEVVYVAQRMIFPGEQLLVSYENEEDGDSYWGPCGVEPYEMNPRTFMVDENEKLIQTH